MNEQMQNAILDERNEAWEENTKLKKALKDAVRAMKQSRLFNSILFKNTHPLMEAIDKTIANAEKVIGDEVE